MLGDTRKEIVKDAAAPPTFKAVAAPLFEPPPPPPASVMTALKPAASADAV